MSRVPPFVLCGKTFTIDITGKLFNLFIFISVMLFGAIDFYHFIIKMMMMMMMIIIITVMVHVPSPTWSLIDAPLHPPPPPPYLTLSPF